MAKLKTIDSIDDLENELGDRYGKNLPMELSNLMIHLRIKVLSRQVDVEALIRRKNEITLKLRHPVGGARVPLERALGFEARVGHQQIKIVINLKEKWLESIMSVLQALNEFRERFN